MTLAATTVIASAATPAIPPLGGATVSATAATWTPQIATSGTDGTVEQIRQLTQCGGTMYAVGRFSSIKRYSTTVARNNAFSFSATTGAITSWDPNVNGKVNSIALSADCATAYLGGTFQSVGGVAANNIVSVSVPGGTVNTGFKHSASSQVETLLMKGTHLLVGGYFTSINGASRSYLASLSPTTGTPDSYATLSISGNYQFTDLGGRAAYGNPTRVYNFEPSPDGTKLLVMGDFTTVASNPRQQMFMADLGSTSMSVDPWYAPDFNGNCHISEPFYLQAAAWSPDMSTVYIATTGYKPSNSPGYYTSNARDGICDAAAAYPSTGTNVAHLWVNYTGCDSLYATAADNNAVYVGGHERWLDSPAQCDGNLKGTKVDSPGMGGLYAATGSTILDGNGVNATTGDLVGKYSRARGLGADDMINTSAGLWIASDNAQNSSWCGKTSTGTPAYGHAGLCFLPYPPA